MNLTNHCNNLMRYSHKNRVNGSLARFRNNRMEPCDMCRVPHEGTPLKTITIKDHITGESTEIEVMQGKRKNQVRTFCNGKLGNPVGWDKVMRKVRKFCVVRWLEV